MHFNFAFDLDGTVTQAEILPVIAKELGIEKEMEILTNKTMDGEIPFDISFTHRVDMLKKIPISRVQNIVSKIPINKTILDFIQKNKKDCYIVTQNLDVWIKPLIEKIGVSFLSSEADYKIDNLYGIKKILRKKEIHSKTNFPLVAIGEGYNDLEMMLDATISIAYGGVHKPAPSLLEVVDYVIYNDKELCRFLKQLS